MPELPRADAGTWQQQMKWAVRNSADLCQRLELPANQQIGAVAEAGFPVFVPLPYLSRIRMGDPNDPLLRQVLPVAAEDNDIAGYSQDPLGESDATLQPGLIQKYNGRVLLVATGTCAIHCRYCFRRHFPYSDSQQATRLMDQVVPQLKADPSIREVILSGGDPLTLVDDSIQAMIEQIESIRHVKRLRIHTRLPIVIPQRVTDHLITMLANTRLNVVVVVHANHAAEIDLAVEESLQRLKQAGVTLLNQSVLLAGVNDNQLALQGLSERLLDVGVLPYYLHQLDKVSGAAHFAVPVERGRELIQQLRANLPGYAVPRYVQEIAGQPNKTVLE